MKNVFNHRYSQTEEDEMERMLRLARNVLRLTLVTGLLGLLFLGAAVGLSGCNNFQPQCVSECYSGIARIEPRL